MSMSRRFLFSLVAPAAFLTACSDNSSAPVAAATPARAFAFKGDGQHLIAGGSATDTLTVLVVGADGAPIANAAITWSGDAAGTLVSSATQTNASGHADAVFSAGTRSGIATITATVAGLEPVVFSVFVDPDSPSRLTAMAPLSDTLAYGQGYTGGGVAVVDQYGNAVPNVDFTTSLLDAESSLITFGGTASDAQGVARVPFAVAPTTPGTYTLRFEGSSLTMNYQIVVKEPEGEGMGLRRARASR